MIKGTEIKKELAKAFNVKSSVFACNTNHGSYRIEVKTFAISVKAVEACMSKYRNVRYCEASGEILSGGNTFVFVDYKAKLTEEEVAAVVALQAKHNMDNLDCRAKMYHMGRAIAELPQFAHLDEKDCYEIAHCVMNENEEFRTYMR